MDIVENLPERSVAAANCGLSNVSEETKRKRQTNNNSNNENIKKQKKDSHNQLYVDKKRNSEKPTLRESGFSWDLKSEDINKFLDVSIDETKLIKDSEKKTTLETKDEETQLKEVEEALTVSESNPKTADQFDRALLARPDDAQLWIKYMSHHLEATEIEKARAVARRALQIISKHQEIERLNVWIAFLNMEHLFGTQESLKDTFEEALRTNDEFTMYSKMLQIISNSNKQQDVEYLVNTMSQKFGQSTVCWIQCCSALMSCELSNKARHYLQRAIAILPQKEHVLFLCKFALLESQHGHIEEARTLFEHILTTYPKRTDVWNVYIDMLVKADKIVTAREILEQATRQSLPARKMKMLFAKWLAFEEKHGNAENIENVRRKAEAYVRNLTKKLE